MTRSMSSQASIAAIVAMVVLAKVRPVSEKNWAESAAGSASDSGVSTIEPTLKPYQPTHSRPAPSMVSVRLCGRVGSRGPADPAADDQGEHQRRPYRR